MGGPRLTPEQIELASTVYARTENVSEAARAIGVNESTLRAFFDRERIARNREAHARACEAGLQEGLAFLMDVARECHGVLTRRIPVGSGLEASDFACLGRTVNQALATVAALDEREDKRRLAPLARRKLRAEIRALDTRAGDLPPLPVLQAKLSPEQILALVRGLSDEQLAALRQTTAPRRASAPAEPTEAAPAKDT